MESEVSPSKSGNEVSDDEGEAAPSNDNRDRYTRHKSHVYIAQGVYTDCENILEKFLMLKTSLFEDFISLWKEWKFYEIFCGRDTYAESLEFCEEVLAIAKSFMLPPHSQIKRIGALYLMYGLYTQQPTEGDVKFRVTSQEWSVILKFVENLKAHGFIDANYIFHKMCLDGAFLTVAYGKEYGLERNFRKYHMPWPSRDEEHTPRSTFSIETLMSKVYRGSLKAAADKCRRNYNSIKQMLTDAGAVEFMSVEGTDASVEQVILQNMDDVADSSADNPGTRKFKNIGHNRKYLREKAFQNQAVLKSSQSVLGNLETEINPCSDNPSPVESDSSDTDFQFIMRPLSKRRSQKSLSRKIDRKKKVEESRDREDDDCEETFQNCVGRASSDEVSSPNAASAHKTATKKLDSSFQKKGSCSRSSQEKILDATDHCQASTSSNPEEIGKVVPPPVRRRRKSKRSIASTENC